MKSLRLFYYPPHLMAVLNSILDNRQLTHFPCYAPTLTQYNVTNDTPFHHFILAFYYFCCSKCAALINRIIAIWICNRFTIQI